MTEAALPNYVATTAFEWTQRAFALLQEQRITVSAHGSQKVRGFVVAGACPRCDHDMVDRRVSVALAGMAGATRGTGGKGDQEEVVVLDVTCGCGSTHQDAPEGVTGCGASFRIELVAE